MSKLWLLSLVGIKYSKIVREFSTKQNVKYWIYVWYISPPFEGGVAGPLFNYDTNADTGRGGWLFIKFPDLFFWRFFLSHFLQIQVPGILICFQTSVLRIQGLQDIDLFFYLFLFYDIHHADFHQAQLQVFLKHKKSQLCSYLYCVVFWIFLH